MAWKRNDGESPRTAGQYDNKATKSSREEGNHLSFAEFTMKASTPGGEAVINAEKLLRSSIQGLKVELEYLSLGSMHYQRRNDRKINRI